MEANEATSSLVDRTLQSMEDRRQRIIDGGVNCIPSPFKRFSEDFCGREQDTYYCITSFTKGKVSLCLNIFDVLSTIENT